MDEALICTVYTEAVLQSVEWVQMGIIPPDAELAEIAVPFHNIRYILSHPCGCKFKLMTGEDFVSTMPVNEAFSAFVKWLKRGL